MPATDIASRLANAPEDVKRAFIQSFIQEYYARTGETLDEPTAIKLLASEYGVDPTKAPGTFAVEQNDGLLSDVWTATKQGLLDVASSGYKLADAVDAATGGRVTGMLGVAEDAPVGHRWTEFARRQQQEWYGGTIEDTQKHLQGEYSPETLAAMQALQEARQLAEEQGDSTLLAAIEGYLSNPRALTADAMRSLSSSIAAIAGGAGVATKLAGLAGAGSAATRAAGIAGVGVGSAMLTGGSNFGDVQEARPGGVTQDQAQISLLTSGASAAIDMLTAGMGVHTIEGMLFRSLVEKGVPAEQAKELAGKSVAEALAYTGKQAGKTALGEAAQETVQSGIEGAGQALATNDYATLQDVADEAGWQAGAGAITGAATGGATHATLKSPGEYLQARQPKLSEAVSDIVGEDESTPEVDALIDRFQQELEADDFDAADTAAPIMRGLSVDDMAELKGHEPAELASEAMDAGPELKAAEVRLFGHPVLAIKDPKDERLVEAARRTGMPLPVVQQEWKRLRDEAEALLAKEIESADWEDRKILGLAPPDEFTPEMVDIAAERMRHPAAREAVLTKVNEERAKLGLPPLDYAPAPEPELTPETAQIAEAKPRRTKKKEMPVEAPEAQLALQLEDEPLNLEPPKPAVDLHLVPKSARKQAAAKSALTTVMQAQQSAVQPELPLGPLPVAKTAERKSASTEKLAQPKPERMVESDEQSVEQAAEPPAAEPSTNDEPLVIDHKAATGKRVSASRQAAAAELTALITGAHKAAGRSRIAVTLPNEKGKWNNPTRVAAKSVEELDDTIASMYKAGKLTHDALLEYMRARLVAERYLARKNTRGTGKAFKVDETSLPDLYEKATGNKLAGDVRIKVQQAGQAATRSYDHIDSVLKQFVGKEVIDAYANDVERAEAVLALDADAIEAEQETQREEVLPADEGESVSDAGVVQASLNTQGARGNSAEETLARKTLVYDAGVAAFIAGDPATAHKALADIAAEVPDRFKQPEAQARVLRALYAIERAYNNYYNRITKDGDARLQRQLDLIRDTFDEAARSPNSKKKTAAADTLLASFENEFAPVPEGTPIPSVYQFTVDPDKVAKAEVKLEEKARKLKAQKAAAQDTFGDSTKPKFREALLAVENGRASAEQKAAVVAALTAYFDDLSLELARQLVDDTTLPGKARLKEYTKRLRGEKLREIKSPPKNDKGEVVAAPERIVAEAATKLAEEANLAYDGAEAVANSLASIPYIIDPVKAIEGLPEQERAKVERTLQQFAGSKWREALRSSPKFSVNQMGKPAASTSFKAMRQAVKEALGAARTKWLHIVPTENALASLLGEEVPAGVAGATYNGQVYFVLENIPVGREKAVLAHELGVHAAMEQYLDANDIARWVDAIRQAARAGDEKALLAMDRAEKSVAAAKPASDLLRAELLGREMLAYYVELTHNDKTKTSLFKQIIQWVTELLNKAGLRLKPAFIEDNLSALVNGLMRRAAHDFALAPAVGVDTTSLTAAYSIKGEKDKTPTAKPKKTEAQKIAEAAESAVRKERPLEDAFIPKAVYHGDADKELLTVAEEFKAKYEGLWHTTRTFFSKLDKGVNFLDNIEHEASLWQTAAVRNGTATDPSHRHVLPSLTPFVHTLHEREKMTRDMMKSNEDIQMLFNKLPFELREQVTQLIHDSKYHGLWAFDPSEWHPAYNEHLYKAIMPDPPTGEAWDKLVKKLQRNRAVVRKYVQLQIEEGNKLHAAGKKVPSKLVAWKLAQLQAGRDINGNKLPEAEAVKAREAALLVRRVFRTMTETKLAELKATMDAMDYGEIAKQIEELDSQIEQLAEVYKAHKGRGSRTIDDPAEVDKLNQLTGMAREQWTAAQVEDALKRAKHNRSLVSNTLEKLRKLRDATIENPYPYVPHVRIGKNFVVVRSELTSLVGRALGAVRDADAKNEDRVVRELEQVLKEYERWRTTANAHKEDASYLKFADDVFYNTIKAAVDAGTVPQEKAKIIKHVGELYSSLRQNPDHYAFLSFTGTTMQRQASTRLKQYFAHTGRTMYVEELYDIRATEELRAAHDTLAALEAAVEGLGLSDDNKAVLRDAVRGLYLDAYADMMVTKASRRYNKVYGFDPSDTMQAVSTYSRETARYVAAIRYNRTLDKLLLDMANEAKRPHPVLDDADRRYAAVVWSTVYARWLQQRNAPDPIPMVEAALTANTFMALTSNPSYFMTNGMQFAMISLPVMSQVVVKTAGNKFVGASRVRRYMPTGLRVGKAAFALVNKKLEKIVNQRVKENRDLTEQDMEVLRAAGLLKDAINSDAGIQVPVKKFLNELIDNLETRELLDMGLNTEMGELGSLATNAERKGKNLQAEMLNAAAKGQSSLRALSQKIEAFNRGSVAVALTLAMIDAHPNPYMTTENGKVLRPELAEEIMERVREVVHDTQGNYSRTVAPRFLNSRSWPRLAVQFMKYNVIMTMTLAKLIRYALPGAITNLQMDPAERMMYRRQLAALMLWNAALLGAAGMPVVSHVLWALNLVGLFCGDDDAECYKIKGMEIDTRMEYLARKAFGDDIVSQFLTYGAMSFLFGKDISSRLGLSNVFGIMPFAEDHVVDLLQSGDTMTQGVGRILLGSVGNTVGRFIDGLHMVSEYEPGTYNNLRGWAYMAPAGVRNFIYAYMWHEEGVRTRSMRELLAPEDLTAWDLTLRILGFQPTPVHNAYAKNIAYNATKKALGEETTRIKRALHDAWLRRDREAIMRYSQQLYDLWKIKYKLGFTHRPPQPIAKQLMSKAVRDMRTSYEVEHFLDVTP